MNGVSSVPLRLCASDAVGQEASRPKRLPREERIRGCRTGALDSNAASQLPKGPPGIPNLGNSCYMGAVLQCLLNSPSWTCAHGTFSDLFAYLARLRHQTGQRVSRTLRPCLADRLAELVEDYERYPHWPLPVDTSVVEGLKDAMAEIDTRYADYRQQDAYEFLGCFLEGLDCDFQADLSQCFCGISTRTTRWCHGCLQNFEAEAAKEIALQLPLLSPGAQQCAELRLEEELQPVTLLQLLEAAQQPEEIEGYDCDVCSRLGVSRTTASQRAGIISETAGILVIALYRFLNVATGDGKFSAVKVGRVVKIPTVLALDTGDYALFAVVSHIGRSLENGHYIAAVRSLRDNLWYECDDSTVRPLCKYTMPCLYDYAEVTHTRSDADPYILFYHRFPMAPPDGD